MLALDTLCLLGALIAATLEPAACPSFPTDPAQLVPSTATAVLGIDVDGFAKTSTGKALLPALRADLQLSEALEILDDCQLALERTYAVTLARDPTDGRFAVVQARGVATKATLDCLAAELRARNGGTTPWTVEPQTCATSLVFGDGSRAWVINDYTLVWARGGFVDPVAARLEGREPLALPASLTREFGRLDRSGHVWLAAHLDDDDRRTLPGAWADEATSITAALDLSEGLRATFSVSAASVTALANLRELTIAGLLDLANRLDEYGVEHRLRERARLGIIDGVVGAEIVLDEAELRSIRAKIGERVVGRGPL
ncbi:hypothetical protein DB30_03295 [Enhygromyxa salina]|uniref:Uncharacterized protein n=1 Tax=Enhygromyxa salina TaxID=215803 RepID=A0A0C2D273_9BACT|nr:hypothetical protein [Enhygromyxa salina]KIG17376.1 hypothetical protein DB30_03295 [Enhygromyxa salina]